ncbi:hypothetical protein AAF712_006217 [Marasmius tenuissimus]|uniref:Uncharacterized protein n=1 Tax=Marasmius tenuissimus TaxID=585030 RepID=A0ABR2ZYJ9_9AGAR
MSNLAFIPPAITVDASITEATFVGTLDGAIKIQSNSGVHGVCTWSISKRRINLKFDMMHDRLDPPFFVDGTQTLGTTLAPTASASITRYGLSRASLGIILTKFARRKSNTNSTDTMMSETRHKDYWDSKPPGDNEKRFAIIVVAVLATLGLIVLALVTWCCIRKRRNREGRPVGERGLLFSSDRMIAKGSSLLSRLPGRTPSYRTVDSSEGKTLLSSPSDTSTICDTDADSYLATKQNGVAPSSYFSPLTERQMRDRDGADDLAAAID